ncbi:hypothetical protein [Sulfobacillus harzensis]|uniref:Uncharacterized protein n=1 Tax=Sulfobacillus harzensis TaxID=2729629 RepID=A0A7Y0L0I1_9FIRM|nr:hypothetical protein [Sulfobacillus harzensis]NMP20788.1 hypothetical protein [Sulfobacillus harzensis]
MPNLLVPDSLRLTGRVRIVTRSPDGRMLRDSGWIANQICNGGAAAVVAWLTSTPNRGASSQAVPYPAYMELGDGTGTPAATDTDLFSPNVATQIHVTQAGPAPGNPLVAQWVGVWGPSYGPYNASEAGLLSADGTLWSHILATIDLTTTASTVVTWQWVLSV